jgi:hypothetical protein
MLDLKNSNILLKLCDFGITSLEVGFELLLVDDTSLLPQLLVRLEQDLTLLFKLRLLMLIGIQVFSQILMQLCMINVLILHILQLLTSM